MYGGFLITYSMEIGWDELVRSMSPNLKGFLDNLDSLHYFIDHVVYKANLRGPSFRCEETPDGTLLLHYFTGRPGLYHIVKGVVKEVAKLVFNLDINLVVQGRTQRSVHMNNGERVEEHVVFLIKVGHCCSGIPNSDWFRTWETRAEIQMVPMPACWLLPTLTSLKLLMTTWEWHYKTSRERYRITSLSTSLASLFSVETSYSKWKQTNQHPN